MTIDLLELAGEAVETVAAAPPSMTGGGASAQSCDTGDMDNSIQDPPVHQILYLKMGGLKEIQRSKNLTRGYRVQNQDNAKEEDRNQPSTLEESKDCNLTSPINEDSHEDTATEKISKTEVTNVR